MATKICLIEKDQDVQNHISGLFTSCPGMGLVGAVGQWSARFQQTIDASQVVLVGLTGNNGASLDTLSNIRWKNRLIKVIFMSNLMAEPRFLKRLLERGMNGYMTKNFGAPELQFALQCVGEDKTYVCSNFVLKMLETVSAGDAAGEEQALTISRVELQVLRLVAEGLTNKQIANALFVSVRTVESRRKRLLEKTGTLNTATLIRHCYKNGILSF